MKTFIKTLIISLLYISTFAQQASEIDPKFVKLPRYNNLAAITNVTTGITTPTQGMMVYNKGTASNWYYNGTTWVDIAFSNVSTPLYLTSTVTTITGETSGRFDAYGVLGRATDLSPAFSVGVRGENFSMSMYGRGVEGIAHGSGNGVFGSSENGAGIFGAGQAVGVAGTSTSGTGVSGSSTSGYGGSFSSTSSHALITGTGNVGIGTANPTAKLDVAGFTKLGDDATVPKIKMKELPVFNSAATINGQSGQNHGLDASKIINVNVLLEWTAGYFAPVEYSPDVNLKYNYFISPTQIVIQNNATNCSYICGKPVKVLITYKE